MAGTITSPTGTVLTPHPTKQALESNYLTDFSFLSTEMPELYEEEFERYGNRSINSFLRNLSAEYPFASDMIKWSEQGRLHTKYTKVNSDSALGADTAAFTIPNNETCNFRVNQTVFLSAEAGTLSAKAIISAVGTGATADTFTVEFYNAAGSPFAQNSLVTAFVYGSEFAKKTAGMSGSLEATNDIFDVKPVIIKDSYSVAGSDLAQIGWIKITTEDGPSGYMWYLKSESETRLRFDDYLEMMMVEHVEADNASGAEVYLSSNTGGGNAGTQGLFAAVEDRGNVWGGGNPTTLADWDLVLKQLDKNGAIAQNTVFGDRDFMLDMDDMLAAQNGNYAQGVSWGLFNNDKDMALNLGFSGFRRGSYDFYKSDWSYLNDGSLRGGIVGGKVNGILVPAGTKTVKDMVLGKNIQRPFLHVRYRASETENRKYKTMLTGSAGGAKTSNVDEMNIDFLSERALITLGANNFFLFQ
jgi:hypothetical protein